MTTPPNIIHRKLSDLFELGKLGLEALRFKDPVIVHLVKIMSQSVRAYLDERFESQEIKATLATDGVIGTNGGPSTPGTAYIMLHHVMGGATGVRGLWGFVRGGMGAISEAIAGSAKHRGAQVRTGAAVDRVLVRNGRAYGVVLDGGEEIHARLVVSSADPKVTFLKLVDAGDIDSEFRGEVEKIRIEGCSMKINLALDRLPEFTAFPGSQLGPHHKATIHVCPSMEYVDRAWEDSKAGRPSTNPLVEVTIPTTYDDSIAPPGKHIMCIFAQYAPP
jgi:phytoene dehydrogenase-like protein